jgi:trk system potassium uptake protein TrkH
MLLSIAMLIPLAVSFIYQEPQYVFPFLLSAIISGIIGLLLYKLFKIEIEFTIKSAMVFSTLIWLIACALGALPYFFAGELSYLNAYFEAMSGFTTTGFSMYSIFRYSILYNQFLAGIYPMDWWTGHNILIISSV